jgi:hypothetical protein
MCIDHPTTLEPRPTGGQSSLSLQVGPSVEEGQCRAEQLATSHAEPCPAALASAAAENGENLVIAHVPSVNDDNPSLAIAALRNVLAAKLRHHLHPSVDPLVIAGPFGIGKRQLMQRMLTLYPDGFCMPRIYTTRVAAAGGQLTVVEQPFLDDLKARGMMAFEEVAVGERYCVSLEDIAECAPPPPPTLSLRYLPSLLSCFECQ